MFIKIIESKCFFLLMALFLKIILDFSYSTYIVKVFAYERYELNFNLHRYILITILLIFLVLICPFKLKKVSDYFFNIFLFLAIYPLSTMVSLDVKLSIIPLILNFLVYIFLLIGVRLKFSNKKIKSPYIVNGRKIYICVSIVMILYLIFLYIITGAISNFNLDLAKVYDFRDVNAELTNFGITAYLNSWVYQVFTIALMGYCLLNKKILAFFSLILIQIFFFGVAAHKSILFSPLMVFGIYFYLSKTKSLATVPLMLFIIICWGTFLNSIDNYSLLSSVLIRRIFFVPASLSFAFFDFFSQNSFNYWSDSILGVFQDRKYYNSIPQEIGNYLGTNARANNGLISSGFAQAGYLGVTIYALILLFILRIINNLSEQIKVLWFPLVLVITPLRNLILSSDIFTVLLTHGLLISLIMLTLYRKKETQGDNQ